MPAVAGGAGGDDAADGGADVWERGAPDGIAAAARQRCGCGTAATGDPRGQGRQGPGDGAAGCVEGTVGGASGTAARVAGGGPGGRRAGGMAAGGFGSEVSARGQGLGMAVVFSVARALQGSANGVARSEEHTSELQSRQYLVCRLL